MKLNTVCNAIFHLISSRKFPERFISNDWLSLGRCLPLKCGPYDLCRVLRPLGNVVICVLFHFVYPPPRLLSQGFGSHLEQVLGSHLEQVLGSHTGP